MKRWPLLRRPLRRPSSRPGTTRLPCSMTTQCTGRMNSSSPDPQRMALPTGRRFRARAAISGNSDAAGLPALRPRYMSHSPLSVRRVSRSSGRQPQDSAKPLAARLQSPPETRAAASGGPRCSTTRDGWRVASLRATTASLRGVAKESTSSNSRPASSRPWRNSLRRARSSPRSAFGGSSSTPISSRKSERAGTAAYSRVSSRGKPIASRDST